MPSVGPYCSAFAEDSTATVAISLASSSPPNSDVSGSPPASEMTSGRSVIASRSRIADERMPCVRLANSAS